MSEIKHTAAFPRPAGDYNGTKGGNGAQSGMTLLDYFAGQELAKTHGTVICDMPEMYDRLADHCYRMADAMIRARGEA